MIKNYLLTAFRNMRKNKVHAYINITGLSVGMAVAILIGLWIWNELSFNKYHKNYNHIAQVMINQTFNGDISSGVAIPIALNAEMRKTYGSDFKHIAMSSWTDNHVLAVGNKKITFRGIYLDKEGPEIFSLDMLNGKRDGLKDPSSILLSESVAKAFLEIRNRWVK
jgi:putative ABC transport system permease protein